MCSYFMCVCMCIAMGHDTSCILKLNKGCTLLRIDCLEDIQHWQNEDDVQGVCMCLCTRVYMTGVFIILNKYLKVV